MKFVLLICTLLVLNRGLAFSQDVIIKTNNDSITAKVIEVGNEIRYKEFDFLNGPTYVILKSDVSMIRYENGRVDTVNNLLPAGNSIAAGSIAADMFTRGSKDAARYYNGYKGAATGTLITSLVSPLLGLIPAAACASTDPKMERLNYPDKQLMKYRDYEYGYRDRAKKIKRAKVWTNWGIGLGVNVVLFIVLSAGN